MAKAKQKSLTINLILNGLFSMSAYLFPMVALPYASRILQPAGVGRVSFATSIIAYFIMVAQLGIPTYGIQACAKVKDDREKLSRTVQELFIISIVMDIIVYAALAVALINVPRLSQDKLLFVALSITILFRSIGMEWLYRALEQYEAITFRAVIFQLLSIAALVTLVKDESDYIIYAFLTVFATQGAGIINFIQAKKYIQIKPLGNYNFKRHLKAVAVFFAMACAIMIYTNLDISMIGVIKGDTEVGYYNVAVKIKLVLVTFITTIGTVLLPRTSYYYVKGMEREFRETCKKAMHGVIIIALPVALYFIIFAKESIMLISGSAFMPSVIPMMIIMLTLPFIGMTNIMGIQMLASIGKEKCTLISVVAGALVDFILNIIFIPRYGAAGAAAGTLAAEIVVWIVQYVFILKYIGNIYQHINCLKAIAACLAGAVCAYIAKTMSCPDIIVLVVSAVIFFCVYAVVLVMAKDEMALEIVERMKGIIDINGERISHYVRFVLSVLDRETRHKIYIWSVVIQIGMLIMANSAYMESAMFAKVISLLKLASLALIMLKLVIDWWERLFTPKEILFLAALSVFICGLAMKNGQQHIIIVWLFILGAHDVDYTRIIKASFWTHVLCLAVVWASCGLGIVENYQFARDWEAGIYRNCMGFTFVTTGTNLFFYTVLMQVYLRKSSITWLELIADTGIAIWQFSYTDTKNAFAATMLIIVLASIWKLSFRLRYVAVNKKILLGMLAPVMMLIFGGASIYGNLNHGILEWFDELVTGRLSLTKSAYETYGIHLFGDKIHWVGFDALQKMTEPYNYVDSSYMQKLYDMGIIFMILFFIGVYLVMKKAVLNKDYYLILVLCVMLLHGTFEPQIFILHYNVFIIAYSYIREKGYDRRLIKEGECELQQCFDSTLRKGVCDSGE